MKNKKLVISLGLGFTISAVALVFSFRNVPLNELAKAVSLINFWWTIPAFFAAVASFFLRVVRWRIILGPTLKLGFWQAFHPMMIGFGANCILPARVGEFARPALLRQRYGASFFGVFATVAAERVFDLMVLLALFATVLTFVPISTDLAFTHGSQILDKATLDAVARNMARLSGLMVAGMIAVSVNPVRALMERVILKTPSILVFLPRSTRNTLRDKACTWIVSVMERIAMGFDMVKSPLKILACLGLSILVWALLALVYLILAQGCPGITLNYFQLTAVMVIVCIFISLPSVPGFWGLWEAGGVFALALYQVNETDAMAYTLFNHVVQILPAIIMGIISAVIMGVNILKIAQATDEARDEKTPACPA